VLHQASHSTKCGIWSTQNTHNASPYTTLQADIPTVGKCADIQAFSMIVFGSDNGKLEGADLPRKLENQSKLAQKTIKSFFENFLHNYKEICSEAVLYIIKHVYIYQFPELFTFNKYSFFYNQIDYIHILLYFSLSLSLSLYIYIYIYIYKFIIFL